MPKGKRTTEKNQKKDRFTKKKGSQARSRVSTAPPPPLPTHSIEGFGSVQVRPSSQNMMLVPPPPPPQNFIGGRFHNPWSSSSYQNYGAGQPNYGFNTWSTNYAQPAPPPPPPNNDAIVAAVTQAVQAAIPTIISAVETRIAGRISSQGPAVETQIAVSGVNQSPAEEVFPLPESYAAIAAKDAAAEQQQFSETQKKSSRRASVSAAPAADDDDDDGLPRQRLYCEGLTDSQINIFLKKTGFTEVAEGAALLYGNTVVVKSGFINMWTGYGGAVSVPNPMTISQWKEVRNYWLADYNVIFITSRDLVNPLWLARQKFRGPYAKNWEKPGKHGVYVKNEESHTGAIWGRGSKWYLVDVNNFEDVTGDFVDLFRRDVKKSAFRHILFNMQLEKEDFKLELYPAIPPYGIAHCCAIYMLFSIEQIANGHPNLDMNSSIALSQLFFKKINFHVGGDYNFDLYKGNNPDWKTKYSPFPMEDVLSGLKDGLGIDGPTLREYLLWLSPYGLHETDGKEMKVSVQYWKK